MDYNHHYIDSGGRIRERGTIYFPLSRLRVMFSPPVMVRSQTGRDILGWGVINILSSFSEESLSLALCAQHALVDS